MNKYWKTYSAGLAVSVISVSTLLLYKPKPETICTNDRVCNVELGERDPLSKNFNPNCGYCGDSIKQSHETAENCPIDFSCGNKKLDSEKFSGIVKSNNGYKFGVIEKTESCDPISMSYCAADCQKPKTENVGTSSKTNQDAQNGCNAEMAKVDLNGKSFCIDKWEGGLEFPDGKPYPYFKKPPEPIGNLRAVSKEGVFPQVQMSVDTAKVACANAGKRLCEMNEWMKACLGNVEKAAYPWGGWNEVPGKCNYDKQKVFENRLGVKSPPLHLFARCFRGKRTTFDDLIDPDGTLYKDGIKVDLRQYPKCSSHEDEMYVWNHSKKLFWDDRLAQIEIGMEKTGSYPECKSDYQVYDMIGSVNEVINTLSNKGKAQFKGGYYLDATLNKPGCMYTTAAHETDYKDYSVGFRCCKD